LKSKLETKNMILHLMIVIRGRMFPDLAAELIEMFDGQLRIQLNDKTKSPVRL